MLQLVAAIAIRLTASSAPLLIPFAFIIALAFAGSISATNFIEAQVQAFLGNHSTAAKHLQVIIDDMSDLSLQNESGGGQ